MKKTVINALLSTFFLGCLSVVTTTQAAEVKKPTAPVTAQQSNPNFDEGVRYYQAKKYDLAIESFEKAASQNSSDAAYTLGTMYRDAIGVKQDDKKAIEWFEKSALADNKEAKMALAFMYLNSTTCKNVDKGVDIIRKGAEKGDLDAMTTLGVMYMQGKYVKQDYKQAEKWLKKPAEAEIVDASTFIGVLYYKQKKYDLAVKYLEPAAYKGDIDAQELLHKIHYRNSKKVKATKKKK